MEPVQSRPSDVEIVVRGRNVVVPEHYRQHVADKIGKLARYDQKICRVDVELQHERNPRQQGICQHVEITCRSRGPVIRSEARAEDFYKALEKAVERLERRLRHAADRRRVHHGRRRPTSLTEAAAAAQAEVDQLPDDTLDALATVPDDDGLPGRIVREKEHPGVPITVDDALEQMELVGHDFYLFNDKESGRVSVVYRRHAFDYGILRLADS